MPTNSKFGKINAGKVNKRGKFNLDHDVATTASFGYVQPLFGKFMIGDSSLKGKISSWVRMLPLPLPPFGKCSMHYYAQFVAYEDLLGSYNAFRAQKRYNTSSTSYIPTQLPSLPIYGPISLFSQLVANRGCVWYAQLCDYTKPTSSNNITTFGVQPSSIMNEASVTTEQINNILGFTSAINPINSTMFYNGFSSGSRCDTEDDVKNAGITPLNADFKIFFTVSIGNQDRNAVIFVRLTQQGRQIRKVLNTLGYQLNVMDSSMVNLMPVFAYYKAWFDIFYPQREIEWTSTNCFKLLHWLSETGKSLTQLPATAPSDTNVSIHTLNYLFMDLGEMFATCEPNYFTTAVPNMNPSAPSSSSADITFSPDGISYNGDVFALNGDLPTAHVQSNGIQRNSLRLLNSLTKFINTNTIIGQSLSKFFAAHFGSSADEEASKFLGAGALDIQLGDVLLTADTEQASAGDYAGVGFGKGDFTIGCKTKKDGYFVVLMSIIPTANYVQGTEYDNYITKPLEIPQPEFDALGYDAVKVGEIFHQNTRDNIDGQSQFGQALFGYQPRYTGHKVHKSVMTGDYSLPSTRADKLGFTLDNYISQDVTSVVSQQTDHDVYSVGNVRSDLLTCGVYWRWLGKYAWLSNFSRIFANQAQQETPFQTRQIFEGAGDRPIEDGFLTYSSVSCTYNAPLLNISASYDTVDGSDNYQDHE